MTTKIKYHTKEAALAAVTKDSSELIYCTPELQNNEEVVLSVVKKNSWTFEYASDELKSNKAFILKALSEPYVFPDGLVANSNFSIKSNTEVMSLVLEKSIYGIEFKYAEGEAALNKEIAAKALVKWGNYSGNENFGLWSKLPSTLQKFFPKESWYEKAQAYLCQLEQEKQAELVSGGSTTEDGVVW